jgi:hypothetical protein
MNPGDLSRRERRIASATLHGERGVPGRQRRLRLFAICATDR